MQEVLFFESAVEELEATIDYYNLQSEGLGFEFALEVQRTLKRISQYPFAWQILSPNARRCRTNRFPYGVIYSLIEKQIVVIAIMHLHRAPKPWII